MPWRYTPRLGTESSTVHFEFWTFLLVWQIPVFKGAAKPLLGNPIDAGHFHGYDGLGDVPDPKAPGLEMVQKEGAVSAMIRIINENPGEVRAAALGCRRQRHSLLFNFKNDVLVLRSHWLPWHRSPTWLWLWGWTHLCRASSEGSTSWEATPNVSQVKVDAHLPVGFVQLAFVWSARGNTTVCGEFNFTADPEAAYIVLKEYQCPIYLACWEFTCHSKLSWVTSK